MSAVHVFTSCNIKYLAKARVFARTFRQHNPNASVHLMLCDEIPAWMSPANEPFDSIILPQDLGIENWRAWAFKHDVVELCTAVKPHAFKLLRQRYPGAKLFYFDPDCAFFGPIDELTGWLDQHSVLLTPHICRPETTHETIIQNETSAMRHGIYNLGFIGLGTSEESERVLDFCAARTLHYCYADIPNGIFTDQRWMDFIPAYFERYRIVREPQYNVATWNYTTRDVQGSMDRGFTVDGRPLCFHHFSGVDSGAREMMLTRYNQGATAVWDLNAWYDTACEREEQARVVQAPWAFGFYDNGAPIRGRDRLVYRRHADLQDEYPEPHATTRPGRRYGNSYYEWLQMNPESQLVAPPDLGWGIGMFARYVLSTGELYVDKSTKLRGWPQRMARVGLRAAERLLGGNGVS